MNTTALALFAAYLVTMVVIGLVAAKRTGGSQEGFFLGGRKLSAFVVALSAVSSGRSAWLVVGASALAWNGGLSALWLFPGYIVAEFVLMFTMGRRLREESARSGAITIPEVLGAASGELGVTVRRVAGVVVVLFMTTYVSAQLLAGGKALESIFELDGETWGLSVTAAIVLLYTFLGGYHAVAMTDVLQGVFMLAGLVLVPLLGLQHVGGFDALVDGLRAIDPSLLDWKKGWLGIVGGLGIGLGSFGNPPILVRAMSIGDPGKLRHAAFIGLTWNVIMAAGTLLMGLVGRVLFTTKSAFPGEDPDFLYPLLSELVSQNYLFAGFVGILLAALFAAIMSTCDSQLLVVASSFVRDFRGERSDAHATSGVLLSRVMVLVALVAAVALSFGDTKYIGPFVLYSWAALGAAIGPALLFALYDKRTTGVGILTGLVLGAASVVVWAEVEALDRIVYELVPAFALSAFAVWVLRAKR